MYTSQMLSFCRPVAAVRAESLVLDRPSIEERLANRVTIPSLQAMYIMAELQHLVEGSVHYALYILLLYYVMYMYACMYV